ncbi:MAG: RDD family protein [Planctomycetes bacterium]|nr:RDD family protein [Planctomycetota bacterium]
MKRHQIITPEQVVFHYEIAGLVTRAMAWTVDLVLLTLMRIAVLIGLTRIGVFGLALIFLGLFLVNFGYYLFFETYWGGQSPGKRLFQLRVISANGGKLRLPDIVIRNSMRLLDTPFDLLPIAAIVAFFDPLHRRLGDMAAETLVVRDVRVRLRQALVGRQSRANSFEADPALRGRILARVTREERDLILDLMARRDELEVTNREQLFAQAAAHFRKRFGLPQDLEHLSDEQVVLNLALVIQGTKFTA